MLQGEITSAKTELQAALSETITLMEQIDEAIDEYGGWPIE
jgi:hypothetical protein